MTTIHVKWIESKLMIGADSNGHALAICKWPEREPIWRGVSPSDMLLLAAASCSLYDVVEILQKQHEALQDLEVSCTGENQSEPVYKFSKIHLHYKATGNLNEEKFLRAIQLSNEKYCTVINTLKGTTEVTFDYEIIKC